MAFTRPHSTAADATFSAAGASAWNANQTPTGADVGGIPYCPTATTETTSANLTYAETSGPRLQVGSGSTTSIGFILGYSSQSGRANIWPTSVTPDANNWGLQFIGASQARLNASAASSDIAFQLANNNVLALSNNSAAADVTITGRTATDNHPVLAATQTWNAAGVPFTGIKYTITDTASAAGSLAMQILGGASGTTNLISVGNTGTVGVSLYAAVLRDEGSGQLSINRKYYAAAAGFAITSVPLGFNTTFGGSPDANISRGGANNLVYSATFTDGAGQATSRAEINKAVTAFTDGVAKTVFTLTIPNAAHSASYLVRLTGSIGAGGAVGANEASATNAYIVTICRTAGVNAVAGISAAFGASTSAVAGATTVTCTGALAAVSGAVGATNTIDIQATITKGGGASDNHTCVATASLLNANATGVTIA